MVSKTKEKCNSMSFSNMMLVVTKVLSVATTYYFIEFHVLYVTDRSVVIRDVRGL